MERSENAGEKRGAAARIALRHPLKALKHREWVLQAFGLADLLYRKDIGGAKLWRLSPHFVEQHSRPLIDPPMIPADEAGHMRGDDVVLGVLVGGEARAYPWWIMDNHHVANDVVGGRPVLITLCEQCSSATALDPVVDGRRLTFWQPYVYNGTIALEDHQTRSVWSPYLAEAIRGKLRGIRLELLPLQHLEWKTWRELHPDTLVLPGELGSRVGHGATHTIGEPEVGRMQSTLANWDERLPHNALVLGVVADGNQRAYPLDKLRERPEPINDMLASEPVAIFHDVGEGTYSALAFSRRVGDFVLTFSGKGREIRDDMTNSSWTLEGRATDGDLAGTQLTFLTSHVSEWFVWAAHFPEIEIAE